MTEREILGVAEQREAPTPAKVVEHVQQVVVLLKFGAIPEGEFVLKLQVVCIPVAQQGTRSDLPEP